MRDHFLFGRVPVFPAIFLLGIYAMLAQMLLLRELLIVFFGNELTIGIIFGLWLLAVSLGALAARRVVARCGPRGLQAALAGAGFLAAPLLLGQVWLVAVVRAILHVPAGEYASFGVLLLSSSAVLLPTGLCIGFFFACASAVPDTNGHAISKLYLLESLGSMVGGLLFTFVFAPRYSALGLGVCAAGWAAGGGALLLARRGWQRVALTLAVMAVVVGLWPGALRSWDRALEETRWRSCGVLGAAGDGAPATRLVATANSRYQNLALTESAGQYVLYANGLVLFALPDPLAYEQRVHFVMAQKPDARRILLLGGNPLGEIPELLKYPVESLTYVELDPQIGELVRAVRPREYDRVAGDRRVRWYHEDGPRFVRACRAQFDLILIVAPEPTTAAVNRYYTAEFHRAVRALLAPTGVVWTSLESSERLEAEASALSASVYKTLQDVYPVVRVTAGERQQYLAALDARAVTLDRQTLFARSRSAGISAQYFRPEYFLGTEELDPRKVEQVTQRLAARHVPVDTRLRPIAYYYSLILWSRFSGSRLEAVLHKVERLHFRWFARPIVALGLAALALGIVYRLRRRGRANPLVDRFQSGVAHSMVAGALAVTGLSAMAYEIILIFAFQSIFGYIYARLGVIMAAFMLGLVLGAMCGRRLETGAAWRTWRWVLGLQLVLALVGIALPRMMAWDAGGRGGSGFASLSMEAGMYALMAVIGWVLGAQFPAMNRLLRLGGMRQASAAAITWTVDNIGAAVGAFSVGVLLVPVIGVGATALLLATLNGAAVLVLFLAWQLAPAGEQ